MHRIIINIIIVLFLTAPSFATDYFVAPDGTSCGDCDGSDVSNPWDGLNSVSFASMGCGDSLKLVCGEGDFTTTLDMQRNINCTSGNEFTITSNCSPSKPTLNGAGDDPVCHTVAGNKPMQFGGPGQYTRDYIIIEYLNVVDDWGLLIYDCDNCIFQNLDFDGTYRSLQLYGGDGSIIQDCTVTNACGGIALMGSPSATTTPITNAIVRRNTVDGRKGGTETTEDCFSIHLNNDDYSDAGADNQFLNNTAHHCNEQGFDNTAGQNTLFQDNISYSNTGSGINGWWYPAYSGGAVNTRINRHFSYDESCFQLTGGATGTRGVTITNSVCYASSNVRGLTISGNPAYTFLVYNNTIVNNSSGDIPTILMNQTATVKNNIFVNKGTGNLVQLGGDTPENLNQVWSNNIYLGNDNTADEFYIDEGGSTKWNWTEWKALTDVSDTIYQDPLFTDDSSNDFSLTKTSPAIGAGEDLGATYSTTLHHTSSWPSSVVTMDQDDNGDWETGAYGYENATVKGISIN